MEMDFNLQDARERLGVYEDLDVKYSGLVDQKDAIIKTLQNDVLIKD